MDRGEPLDHPAILLGGLGRVALADQFGQEGLHPIAQLGARVAAAEERFGAAGGLDRLDPGDRVAPPAARARSRFFEASARAASTAGPDRSLAPLPLAVHPAPSGRADQRGGEHRRRQGQRQQPTPALPGGPGLGPGLGQLGLPQPPLDAAEVRRQPGDHRARVPRPMLRRGGQARPRQVHQLRVGVARVEACQRVRQVGPLRLAVDLGRGLRPRTRAGR